MGAAVATTDGGVYTGANVENASYGLSLCAERVALAAAIAGGARRVSAVAVVADGRTAPPCGACRQLIAEFADESTRVHFLDGGLVVTKTIGELLPGAFRLPGDDARREG